MPETSATDAAVPAPAPAPAAEAAATAAAAPPAETQHVVCTCGAQLLLPLHVTTFRCGGCGLAMSVPAPLSEAERARRARRALNRWLVREAVSKELDNWLSGRETFGPDSQSVAARFYRVFCAFPLFSDKSTGIDKALLDFFLFLPSIEEKLVRLGDQRSSVRARFVNYIAGPIFYATFGEEEAPAWAGAESPSSADASRGEKRDAFKGELVGLLHEVEKPDGAATILEAIESSHSIDEIPGGFGRMMRAHRESAVANLEHSLAKPGGRSKLKSLYHLVPRRTIIKMMKLQMGSGLATAAINLFMVKPFGSRSLMQRMAATTLGINEAEGMVSYASRKLSPAVLARCDAFLARCDATDRRSDIAMARDEEILRMLGSEELSAKLRCAPVPPAEITALRAACAQWYAQLGSRDAAAAATGAAGAAPAAAASSQPMGLGGGGRSGGGSFAGSAPSTSDSDSDGDSDGEEAAFDVNQAGEVLVANDSLQSRSAKTRTRLIQRLSKRQDTESERHAPHPLQFVRLFCEQTQLRQVGDALVELLGDEPLERFVRVSLPVIQQHMISVSARGSGLIPLMEGLFEAWRTVLQMHKDKKCSLARKREAFRAVVDRVHELTFTLVHNLVRGDRTGKWHELAYWLVDLWNRSKINVDTDTMLAELSEADRALVDSEAELLRRHHEENSRRVLGSQPIPPPALDAAWRLVAGLRCRIAEGLFAAVGAPAQAPEREAPPIVTVLTPKTTGLGARLADLSLADAGFSKEQQQRAHSQRALSAAAKPAAAQARAQPAAPPHTAPARPRVKRLLSGFDVQHIEHQARLFLSHLEVVYSYEDDSTMTRRGYERVPVDFNGDGDTQSWLWIRRSLPEHQTAMDGTELSWMTPITDLRVVDVDAVDAPSTEAVLRGLGYHKIAKALNKRSHYVWYKRDPSAGPLRNVTAVNMDEQGAKLRHQALKSAGYAVLAPIMKCHIKTFFGMSSKTISIGLFVKR
jgi:hypothetical protein